MDSLWKRCILWWLFTSWGRVHPSIILVKSSLLQSVISSSIFNDFLGLSEVWSRDKTRSVFMEVPINLSHVIKVASKHGFVFHHARENQAVLCKWLVDNEENKIPLFSNHTIGVAGLLKCFWYWWLNSF